MSEIMVPMVVSGVCLLVGYALGYMDGSKNERRECNRRLMRVYDAGVKEGRNMQ